MQLILALPNIECGHGIILLNLFHLPAGRQSKRLGHVGIEPTEGSVGFHEIIDIHSCGIIGQENIQIRGYKIQVLPESDGDWPPIAIDIKQNITGFK